ncbi:hypothetical protein MKW98_031849 [Papaver atlanticum]|uniref:Vesicle-fusing ATPase n=1 Tax=Papaver atlanticum TaxID=357466 RepID=A0AAD4XC84_9MAGN|nr:hypothetical protein MKW98_031849 [Papaver atlanticum]
MARQIGQMLNGKDPKIVNGPEVLSKFVGETEKNIRDLFSDAENDQRTLGDQSELHVIIFDEIDAICVVKSVISYALNRQLTLEDLTKTLDEESIKVNMDDFLHALQEIIPALKACTVKVSQENCSGGMMLSRRALSKYLRKPVSMSMMVG